MAEDVNNFGIQGVSHIIKLNLIFILFDSKKSYRLSKTFIDIFQNVEKCFGLVLNLIHPIVVLVILILNSGDVL